MTELRTLPKAPSGVQYALTVPQSVMFADLSLRGSKREVFRRVFGINYEPKYIAIDYGGAMSWDYTQTDPFIAALAMSSDPLEKPESVTLRFIETMGRTSRFLVRTAQIVGPQSRRRNTEKCEDLLEDLNLFWDAYEAHMSSLFTFWNVETLITDALVESLRQEGKEDEIESGLPTFIRPSEPNWFLLEQSNLFTLKQRLSPSSSSELRTAATDHAEEFGFLLAPFNIGEPPTPEMVVDRMKSVSQAAPARELYEPIVGYSPRTTWLGYLERQLSFWKTERLDSFALADARALSIYRAAAEKLGVPIDAVFLMTRNELSGSLAGVTPDLAAIESRRGGYCLALIDGNIEFYEPTPPDADAGSRVVSNGSVLRGTKTSPGVVVGRVRIVQPGETPLMAEDEILVTPMTRPDMGAALDQALAYVTDEGGRLSHAAIVSREKHKPCVTATGNATHVLRPGMLIEVNGDEGTVTVLDASFLSDHP